MPATSISVRIFGLTKTYESDSGPTPVLAGVDLELAAGNQLAIVGPSGSGKSTLLHILGGIDSSTSGTVEVAGIPIEKLSARERAAYRNRTVGFVFQDHHLLPQCTVLENILLPTLPAGGATLERIDKARSLIESVGLTHRINHRPSQLSGGERQRAAIARALINEPSLLLCDEPTGNLDRVNAEKVADLLISLASQSEAILIVVTHSLEIAAKLEQRMELLDGRLVPLARAGDE